MSTEPDTVVPPDTDAVPDEVDGEVKPADVAGDAEETVPADLSVGEEARVDDGSPPEDLTAEDTPADDCPGEELKPVAEEDEGVDPEEEDLGVADDHDSVEISGEVKTGNEEEKGEDEPETAHRLHMFGNVIPNDEEAQEDPRELRRRLMRERREKHQKRFDEPPEPEEYKFQSCGPKPAVTAPVDPKSGGMCCAAPPSTKARALEFEQEAASAHEGDEEEGQEDLGNEGAAEPEEDPAAEPLEHEEGISVGRESVHSEPIPEEGIEGEQEEEGEKGEGLEAIEEGNEEAGEVDSAPAEDGEAGLEVNPPAEGESEEVKVEGEQETADAPPPAAEVTAAA